MSAVTKDTIYIDVDDEITAIIEKVQESKHKVVALVLPKRATMLQSIVNMKLLKRTAESSGKHLVLVTTEPGLLPLAGAVGLLVATTPQSKPAIPAAPAGYGAEDGDHEGEHDLSGFDPKENAAKPIGELTGASTAVDTIELDNKDIEPADHKAVTGGSAKAAKKGKKKPKIPNFNTFRKKLLLGASVLTLLIIFGVLAFAVLPKATIALKTDSEDVQKTIDLTLDTTAKSVNNGKGVVPAVIVSTDNTQTATAPATGQQNNGQKAQGKVKIINCSAGDSLTIPAGTTLSSDGMSYITQESANLPFGSKACKDVDGISSDTVGVAASNPGAQYNIGSSNFVVSGYQNVTKASSVGAMTGGTDNIVKVVAQADIDAAKQKLAGANNESAKNDLKTKLTAQDLYVITDSFNAGTPQVTVSAKAGDQVDSVTVTQKTTATMAGAKKDDLNDLITEVINQEIDTKKQKVLNTGLDKAVFKLQSQTDNSVLMSMHVTALAGPELNEDTIKQQVAGKKTGDAEALLKQYPGVTDVEVSYSPFWVSSIPKSANKINITYEK